MVYAMSGEKILSIEARAITSGPISYSLYYTDSSRGMVLYAPAFLELTDAHVETLSSSGRIYYFSESDSSSYLDYTIEKLDQLMMDNDIRHEAKTRMIYCAGKSAVKKLLNDPYSDEGYRHFASVADHQINLLSKGPDTTSNTSSRTSADEYIHSNSVNIGALNALLAMEMFGHNENLGKEFVLDGSGYPDGLKGKEIPLSARVTTVSDVYDALTSNRAYSYRVDPVDALSIMAGIQGYFDSDILMPFIELLCETIN